MVTVSVAALVFYRFGLGEIGWGLVPVIGVLMLCGWCTAMLVIGLLLRYGQSAEILAWATTFVLLALSGVFNPVESLPGRDPADRQGPSHHLRLPRRARPARRRADPVERPRSWPRSARSCWRACRCSTCCGCCGCSATAATSRGTPSGCPGIARQRSADLLRRLAAATCSTCAGVALVLVGAADGGRGGVLVRGRRSGRAGGDGRRPRPPPSTAPPTTTTTALRRSASATLAFGGDILIHSGVWEAADTGAGYDFSPMLAPDRAAPDRGRPGDLPPRGHPRPSRGGAVELPAVPGAWRRWRPTWPRRASMAARSPPTTRSTSGSRAWWPPSTASTPPASPTPAPPAHPEGRVPAIYDAGRHPGRPPVLRLRVQRLRAASRQGVARRPDRPGADPRRRPRRPDGRRGAGRRVAALGQRVRRTRSWRRSSRSPTPWPPTSGPSISSSATTPTWCSRSRRSVRCGWCGAWATCCRATRRSAAPPRPPTAWSSPSRSATPRRAARSA